ncbi:hypothetical protein [Alteribacter natronophilus]|uniref:hypothetical protein n=1 Tax=Alteribacter natronophilus TaxID=2583810 RepID=UPI00110E7403|nr:hypothetical protein [Alteribacter natronophilus]TMW71832.1 hypothetical protein FGB90_12515 [Alteribacter natronophilus]
MKLKNRSAVSYLRRETVFLEELFDEAFMRRYTDFRNFDEMVEASGICLVTAKAQKEIESCPLWSRFVAAHTAFSGWAEMKLSAIKKNIV